MPCQTRGAMTVDSDSPDAGPGAAGSGGAPSRSPPGRRRRELLLAKRRVLEALGQTELAHALGRNLDGLTRLGIASHARLAVGHHQLAEAGEHEAVLGFLTSQAQSLVEQIRHLLL